MASDDPVLEAMAQELHEALKARGLDPRDPPPVDSAPMGRAFQEYQSRGGIGYLHANEFIRDLVLRVGQI